MCGRFASGGEKMRNASPVRVIASALALLALMIAAPAADAHGRHAHARHNPVIFVHGGFGSGAQFESQKLRFTSNGYPAGLINVLEYDSTFALNTMEQVEAKLDDLIAKVEAETGRSQVDLLGHSLGTFVSQTYLNSSPQRAANVAHYVNIDGGQAASPPGGVPTLAIWAGAGAPGRSIGGATNVTVPNQTHVQSATSPETFAAIYEFFTGHPPATTRILRERRHWIDVAGRAVDFPQNAGVQNATLEVWPVRGSTGARTTNHPLAIRPLSGDGAWGPIRIERGGHYEFAIARSGAPTHHFYFEPFQRSDYLVRLLTSEPNQGVDALIEKAAGHSALVVTRYKELWGDQGSQSDVLTVDGTNVVNAATSPRSKLTIGLIAFDAGSDGSSNLSAPLPALSGLPFITGVDLYIPAAQPPSRTVTVGLQSRGAGPVRTLRFPNFPSTTDAVSVQFDDYEQ
jgi:pimeloyl-ACP methyl ester carboxylesterase